jgi:hypothetical protein
VRRAISVVLLCILALSSAPPISAEPETATVDDVAADAVTPAIGWSQLGLSDTVELRGSDQEFTASVPVPNGVMPAVLTGQVGTVINAVDGRIDVFDDRRTYLGTIAAPVGPATEAFALDISAAHVSDGTAGLVFILRENNPPANSCSQLSSATLSRLASSYSGPIPNSRTVADFLPGYLEQVVIRIGTDPTVAQQQSALTLVARLTRLYRPMPVRIDVDTSPVDTPLPQTAFGAQRVIEIRDGGAAGLVVERPDTPAATLVVSGTGAELPRQVELFADARYKLAQSTSAAIASAVERAPKSGLVKSFGELGMTGQISVLGTATMYLGFDVGQFGVGPIEGARLHLRAHYTPVVGGTGSVLVRAGSTVVMSHVLDESGVVDLEGDIPADAVRSNVGIGIDVRYTPDQECAPLNDRITFTVDPGSTVAVSPGFHTRGGFGALPMAFSPDFNVAVDQPDHIRFAASVINLLGQQTSAAMQPRLVSLDEGAKAGTGLLVVAPGDELSKRKLNPPLLLRSGTAVTVNGNPSTDAELNGDTGALQAFTDNGRVVVAVGGAGNWALVDSSLGYIRGLENRWGSLTGDVVATGGAGTTVNLTVREGAPLIDEYPGDGWKWWAWLSVGAASVIVVLAAALVLIRRRRRRATD